MSETTGADRVRYAFTSLVAAILLLGSSESRAQEPASANWERVFATVRSNKRIRVSSREVGTVTGRLVRTQGDTVLLWTGTDSARIALASIDSVWVATSHWKTGVVIAGGGTAVAGLVLATGFCGNLEGSEHCNGASYAGGVLIGAVPGVVVGGLIGGLIPRWQSLHAR